MSLPDAIGDDGPNFFELLGAFVFGLSALRSGADVLETYGTRGSGKPPVGLALGSLAGSVAFVLGVRGSTYFHVLHPGQWALFACAVLLFARHLSMEAKVRPREAGFLCFAASLPFLCLAGLGVETVRTPACVTVWCSLMALTVTPLPQLLMRLRDHDHDDDSDDEDEHDLHGARRRLFALFFATFFYIAVGAPARQCARSETPDAPVMVVGYQILTVFLANGFL